MHCNYEMNTLLATSLFYDTCSFSDRTIMHVRRLLFPRFNRSQEMIHLINPKESADGISLARYKRRF